MNDTRNNSVGCFGLVGNVGIVIIGMAAILWFVNNAPQIIGMSNTLTNSLNNLSRLLGGG